MTVVDDYLKYTDEYKLELGENTVVLMQIGSFFEIYSDVKDDKDIHRVANILNIIVSKKNKKIDGVCRKNPLMAGFPMLMLDKYVELLIKESFSVVVVEQVTDPPNPAREITKIWSPGTYPGIVSTNEDANNIMFCYVCDASSTASTSRSSSTTTSGSQSFACGIAILDCGTGMTHVDEIVRPKMEILQNVINLGIRFNPKEVIVSFDKDSSKDIVSDIEHVFRHKAKKIHKTEAQRVDVSMHRVKVILESFYTNDTQWGIFEYLEMERMSFAATALSQLLHFTTKHKLSFQKVVRRPKKINHEDRLSVSYNAFDQLNVTAGEVTLLSILNRSKTSIGKRYFNFRLLNPFSSAENILRSYQNIAIFDADDDLQEVREELSEVKDIQKIALKPIWTPKDVYSLHLTLRALRSVARRHPDLLPSNWDGNWDPFEYLDENFDCDLHSGYFHSNASLTDEDVILFKRGTEEMNSLRESISEVKAVFSAYIEEMNPEHFKLEHNDREGYYLSTTTRRFHTYKDEHSLLRNSKVSHGKSGYTKVFVPEEKELNARIVELVQQLQSIIQSAFETHVTRVREMFGLNDALNMYVTMIEHLDFYSTCCVNNINFRLNKPDIVESQNNYLRARGLRHLLVEHVSGDMRYVPNDIDLESHGVLLYGVNASGKSCFMKSVAIAVIMAQAGMYVSASSFEFCPFESVFTRITGNDNLFRRQSTFILEMSELRQILKHGNDKSLVIGDELCSGTETISGVSIVTSAIKTLSSKRCCFLFATHLHELNDLVGDTTTKVFHFSVTHKDGIMIYERKIKPGSGDTLYGLEVCKSLDMDDDFVETAFKIRHQLLKLDNKNIRQSRYNSEFHYHMTCHVCRSNTDTIEIHHIVEQHRADTHGNIGSIHKNSAHNLVALCRACHDKVHSGAVTIDGYVMSSKGKLLSYS